MKQTEVAARITAEMVDGNMASRHFTKDIYDYILQAYAAGVTEGRKVGSHERKIVQYELWGEKVKEHESGAAAGRALGVNRQNINKCLKGVLKTASGYKWRYKEDGIQDNGKSD